MENALEFVIGSLLTDKEGRISGPMSPMLFASEMAKQVRFKYNRLARVRFGDEKIFQEWEDGGLTGYDTLIIATRYEGDLFVSLWIDTGVGGMPVASSFMSDRELIITPFYQRTAFARKLTDQELTRLFDHIFANPEVLDIQRANQS
jgi:hypothetical protein